MIITKLQRRGTKTHIFFDDGSNIPVDSEFLINSNFEKDKELPEKIYLDLLERGKYIEVRNSAFRFLSLRIHSRGELELKLLRKKLSKETINDVLDELAKNNILNDRIFCEKFIEEKIYSKRWGLNKIIAHLRNKKIDEKIIQSVINENDYEEAMVKNINHLIENKLKFLKNKSLSDIKLKQKLFSFLISRGFNFEESKNSIDKFLRQK